MELCFWRQVILWIITTKENRSCKYLIQIFGCSNLIEKSIYYPYLRSRKPRFCNLLFLSWQHQTLNYNLYAQDNMKLMDDLAALRPTIFCSVPRLYNRIYAGWSYCSLLLNLYIFLRALCSFYNWVKYIGLQYYECCKGIWWIKGEVIQCCL